MSSQQAWGILLTSMLLALLAALAWAAQLWVKTFRSPYLHVFMRIYLGLAVRSCSGAVCAP